MSGVILRKLPLNLFSTTRLTIRMASNYLINDPKYSFLKELGLESTNLGVYDGTWKASGSVSVFHKFNIKVLIANLLLLIRNKKRKLIRKSMTCKKVQGFV